MKTKTRKKGERKQLVKMAITFFEKKKTTTTTTTTTTYHYNTLLHVYDG